MKSLLLILGQPPQRLRLFHLLKVVRKLMHVFRVLSQIDHLVLDKTLDEIGNYSSHLAPFFVVLGNALRLF